MSTNRVLILTLSIFVACSEPFFRQSGNIEYNRNECFYYENNIRPDFRWFSYPNTNPELAIFFDIFDIMRNFQQYLRGINKRKKQETETGYTMFQFHLRSLIVQTLGNY